MIYLQYEEESCENKAPKDSNYQIIEISSEPVRQSSATHNLQSIPEQKYFVNLMLSLSYIT